MSEQPKPTYDQVMLAAIKAMADDYERLAFPEEDDVVLQQRRKILTDVRLIIAIEETT